MSSKLKNTQSNFLLKTEVALTNVLTNAEIAAEMEEFGYDRIHPDKIGSTRRERRAAIAALQERLGKLHSKVPYTARGAIDQHLLSRLNLAFVA